MAKATPKSPRPAAEEEAADVAGEKWELPELYKKRVAERVREDRAVLEANEAAARAEWQAAAGTPFASPSDRVRANALAEIEHFHSRGLTTLAPFELLQLAEQYALTGRFDRATRAARRAGRADLAETYLAYWVAVWREDEVWCKCADAHRFVELDIYSLKHGCRAPLLRCNSCGTRNVRASAPADIESARAARRLAAQLTRGASPLQARAMLAQAGFRPHTKRP